MADGDEEDKDSKTEDPTPRRLEEAIKKGQVPFSREVSSFLILFVFALTIAWYIPASMPDLMSALTPYLANAEDVPMTRAGVGEIFMRVVLDMGSLMITPLLLVMVAAFLASFMQNGIILSTEPLIPKLEKISPKKGLKRIFSMRSVIEFLKGIFKITVVGTVAWLVVETELYKVKELTEKDITGAMAFLLTLLIKILIGVCVAVFFIALIDLIYQRFDYIKNLRMSKKEIKDEYKQQEGDPMIKQKLRQIRMERAQNRMMQAVPEADVVITNPTHFAVALKYEAPKMTAPVVVAKGQDNIALTIRRVAEENDVPVVENAPLARALFKSVEIDDEVPVEHYQAVAEIISYVFKLKGKQPK